MTKIEEVAKAVREEIVRQYRDDERGKCPAGAAYYSEHIAPDCIARAAIAAMREPTKEMNDAAEKVQNEWQDLIVRGSVFWRAMIDEALK